MDIGVLVTGVGHASTGEAIMRALQVGRRRYRLTVASPDARGLIVAPGVNAVLLPRASDPRYLEALADAARRADAGFIFPGSETEMALLSERRAEFAALSPAVVVMNNCETMRLCSDREVTAQAVAACGLRVPRHAPCASVADALQAMNGGGLRYPVVLKPRGANHAPRHIHIAQNERELRFFVAYALNGGRALALQEYVGSCDDEYSVSVVHYPDGSYGGCAVLRRCLESPPSTRLRVPNHTPRADLGSWLALAADVSEGELRAFPDIAAPARKLAEHFKSTGPVNIQGRMTGAGLTVFEVNAGFTGGVALRARAGHNAPEAFIDWHRGEPAVLDVDGVYTTVRSLADFLHRES